MEKLVNRSCLNSLRILRVPNLVTIKFLELSFIEKNHKNRQLFNCAFIG